MPSGRLARLRGRRDCFLCCVAGLAALVHPGLSTARPAPRHGTQPIDAYVNLPLTFETNRGQASEPGVKFLCRGAGYTLFLTAGEVVLVLEENPSRVPSQRSKAEPAALGPQHSKLGIQSSFAPLLPGLKFVRFPAHQRAEPRAWTVLRMRLLGAESLSQVVGLDELPGKSNYFLGSDPEKWLTNVPSFARVEYQDVYPGVDLVYYGNQRRLEYDFVVSPGADPRAIRLDIQGADKIDFDTEGNLRLETVGGEVRLHKPVVYQPAADEKGEGSQRLSVKKRFIEGRFALRAPSKIQNQKPEIEVGFEIASYDPARPLVIDPLLSYSTYLGGHGSDLGSAIAVDSAGSAYVTGYTLSTDFPTTSGTLQSAFAGGSPYGDVFVAKLSPAASALVYSTYLGGGDDDLGTGITVDSAGNAYVTGYTRSNNFPTTSGALRRTLAGGTCGQAPSNFPCGDAFVAKLNPAGNGLVYSTYLGGSQDDWAFAIALDSSASAYVTGYSESTDFPATAGVFEPTASGGTCGADPCPEAFVTKLNAAGSTLVYSTYLGGIGGRGYGIAVDSSGNAYLAGSTDSLSFPTTPGAFQTVTGQNGDAFVVKLKPDGSGLVYSTYLGGGGVDVGTALALDSSGNAYVTGLTDSFNFPTTPGVLQRTCGGCASSFHDAFVAKLNAAGSALLYSARSQLPTTRWGSRRRSP